MSLTFPNASRSFDEVRNAVRFVGYDGMFEVRFFVDATALLKTAASRVSEIETLRAFDAARTKIELIAKNMYSPKRGSLYTLTAKELA